MSLTHWVEVIEKIWVGQGSIICMFSYNDDADKSKLSNLAVFTYGKRSTRTFKQVDHKIYSGEDNSLRFKDCYPTQDSRYFVFQYESEKGDGDVFVSWDMLKNREEANFIARSHDTFVGYVNGVSSKRGYLLF